MEIKNLIPADKFDLEAVDRLKLYSVEEIEPHIPKLLEWLQDGNWPVAGPLGNFLVTLPKEKLTPYLMEIMNGNDMSWKYFLIGIIGSHDHHLLGFEFIKEIKRIAENPTELEVMCELDEMAQHILA